MGKIGDAVAELVKRNLDASGIVVWFDPDKHYQDIVQNIKIGDAKLFIFDGSFFSLKYELSSLLEQMDPPNIVVYIPKDRNETENALVELEKAGCILAPGHPSINQNTRLEVIARSILRPLMPDSVDSICKQIASGSLTLDDVERIAEQGEDIGSGTIKLIFGTSDPVEVALIFLNEQNKDDDIIKKSAMTELISIFHNSYDIEFREDIDPAEVREKLGRYVFLGDFLKDMSDNIPSELSSVNIPKKDIHKEPVSRLAKKWRDNINYQAAYIAVSEKVEQEYGIASYKIPPEKLLESETFVSSEEILIEWTCRQILAGSFSDSSVLASKRKSLFWSTARSEILMKWNIIESVSKVCITADIIKNALKKRKWKPIELIELYSEAKDGWFLLDSYHRELEQRFELFDMEISDEHSLIEGIVTKARQVFRDTVNGLAVSFQASCESSDFDFDSILLQRDIFANQIKPLLPNGRIAYIWVDALRFEMAIELISGLGDDFEVLMKPAIATLPTITEIGMASLLPDAEREIRLEESGKGKLALNVGGSSIKIRNDRMEYIANKVGEESFFDIKLDEILKPGKKVREQISKSSFILVTSQEIDEICEQGNIMLAHRIMGDILNQIRKAIINLAELNVENIILTSDHGFLLFENIESSEKVDPPGGKTIDLHERAWVGNGGSAGNSYMRLKESDIGLSGSYELAFPKGIGCFKVKGPDNSYFHGGISLQEVVIPVISIKKKFSKASKKASEDFELSMEKQKITTRFFSIRISWKSPAQQQLIPITKSKRRVQLKARAEGKDVGSAVQAVYGYEDGTGDIILESYRTNHATIMLTDDDISKGSISIHMLDSETQAELARIDEVLVDIAI